MKNTLLVVSLLAAGAMALPAAAQNSDGYFINGNIGHAKVDRSGLDDSDTAYGINTGYRWGVSPNAQVGLELGYTELGKYKPVDSLGAVGQARLKGWSVGMNTHIDIMPEWYFSARGGYFRGNMRADADFTAADIDPIHINNTSNKWYAGVGTGYNISEHANIGVHYDRYMANTKGFKMDPDVWSVRMEYRY